jgi:broad specificity phosphatase PhoE
MIIYITRHGQPLLTPADEGQTLSYQPGDMPLSALGQRQATSLGCRLASMGFEGTIYSSPYRRTSATAQLIAEALDTTFYVEPALREIVKHRSQMEGFRGLGLDDLESRFPRIAPDAELPYPWWTLDVEEDDTVLQRMRPFLERLVEQGSGDVLLVGHGASVGASTRFFLSLCQETPDDIPLSWNCALTAFELTSRCRLLLLRDTAHLAPPDVTSNALHKTDGPADT